MLPRGRLVICFSFALLAFPALGYGQKVLTLPERNSAKIDHIYTLLQKPEILSLSDFSHLQALSAAREDVPLEREQCERLLTRAEDKIDADKNSLEELFSAFEQLAEQRYARRVQAVDPQSLAGCRRSFEGLSKKLETRPSVRTFYANDKDRAVCRAQLEKDLDILANEGTAQSFPSVWGVFRETLKEAYPFWNAHYQTLRQARASQERSDVDRPRQELNAEEKQFMYLFEKVQKDLRRLSDADF